MEENNIYEEIHEKREKKKQFTINLFLFTVFSRKSLSVFYIELFRCGYTSVYV